MTYMVDRSKEDESLDSQESNDFLQNLEGSAVVQVQETVEYVNPPFEPIVPPSSSSTLAVDGQQNVNGSTAASDSRSRRISEAILAYDGGSTDEILNAVTRPGNFSTSTSEQAAATGDTLPLQSKKTHVNVDEKSTNILSKTTAWAGAMSSPNPRPITVEPGRVQGTDLARQGHPSAHGLVEWLPREGGQNLTTAACPSPVVRPPQQYFPPHSLHPLSPPVQLVHHPLSAVPRALPPCVHPFNGQHASYPSPIRGATGITRGSDYSVSLLPGYGQPLSSTPGPPLNSNTVRAPDGVGGYKIFHPGENRVQMLQAQQYHSQYHQYNQLQHSQLDGMPTSHIKARSFGNTSAPPTGTTSGRMPVRGMPSQHFHGLVHGIPARASSREGHVDAPAPCGENVDTQPPATDGGTSTSSADAREADTDSVSVSGDGGTTGVDVKGGKEREREESTYNDIGLVVARTKTLEMLLKDLFGASGNGLNDLLSSLKDDSRIDRRTQQKIRSIATIRNKLVHSVDANKLSVSNTFGDDARRVFKKLADDLETTLQEDAKKEREVPFQQGARPTEAYKLGNHPAFRGIAGVNEGEDDEPAVMEEAGASKRAVVAKNKPRFPHNLVTESGAQMTRALSCSDAPDVADLKEFPGIIWSNSGQGKRMMDSEGQGQGGGGSANGTNADAVGVGNGGWDGRIQVVSGRGVCRKLGQGDDGHVATTHTMSGVYRKWGLKPRNPMPSPAWNSAPKNSMLGDTSRVIPGAGGDATGKVAFSARGLDLNKKASRPRDQSSMIRARSEESHSHDAPLRRSLDEAWNTRQKRGQKDNRPLIHTVKKSPRAHFWLGPGVSSNYRGWFPTRQDWFARGTPSVSGPLQPSTGGRIEAIRYGNGLPIRLALDEDEERLVRIAMRESVAEYERAYQKMHGTEADREAKRKAQERAKAIAEQESLDREEREQLEKGIKASLKEAVRPGEEDYHDVIATIEASKFETSRDEDVDPDILRAIAESRRQHDTRQEMLQVQLSYEIDRSIPRDEGILFPQAASSLDGVKDETLLFSPSSSSSAFSMGTGASRDTFCFLSEQEKHLGSQGAEGEGETTGGPPTYSAPLWPAVSSKEMEATRGSQSPRYPPNDAWNVCRPKDASRCVQPDEQSLEGLESLADVCGDILPSTGSAGVNDGWEGLSGHQPPFWESFDVPRLPGWPSPASQPPVGDGSTVTKDACSSGGAVESETFTCSSSVVGLVAAEERELEAALEASRQAEAIREQEERDAKAAIEMAMKLSVKESTAPSGFGTSKPYLSGNGPVYPGETAPSAPFCTEAGDGIVSLAKGETLEYPGDPSMRESVIKEDGVSRVTNPAFDLAGSEDNVLHLNSILQSHGTDIWETRRKNGTALDEEEKVYEGGDKAKGNGETEGGGDEVASMLKHSGLMTSLWELEGEDLMASVLEKSRREKEQEDVAVEHRELEKALLSSRDVIR